MFLNLGHTIGHLIEKDSDFSVSHGQAVAIGILKGLEIAETKYHLDNNVKHQFEDFLNKKSLKTDYKFSNDINSNIIFIIFFYNNNLFKQIEF